MSGNAAAVLTKPAFRKIEWLERDIAVERRPDGVDRPEVAHSAAALREAYSGIAGEMGQARRPSASGWRSAAAPTGNGARCPTAKPSAPSTG